MEGYERVYLSLLNVAYRNITGKLHKTGGENY